MSAENTSSLPSTSQTVEATNKGAHGDDYEEKIVTLQALTLYFLTPNFEFSSNDVRGEKFDDIVVTYYDKNDNNKHEALMQIKHASEDEKEAKALTIGMLLSVSKQQKLSLVKYFAKYCEGNLRGKNLILFTNRIFKFETKNDKEKQILKPKRCQIEKGKQEFVYFDEIEDKNDYLVTKHGENYKINFDDSPDFVKIFKDNYFKMKNSEANDEDIKIFFDDLTFSVGQISDKKAEEEIERLIRKRLTDPSDINSFSVEIRKLLKIKDKHVEIVTSDDITNIFEKVENSSHLKRLKHIPSEIKIETQKYCFQESFVASLKRDIEKEKIIMLHVQKGLEKVICRAVYQTLSTKEIEDGKLLCISLNTFKIEKENILKIATLFECLLVYNGYFDVEMIDELQCMSKNFKIILIFSTSHVNFPTFKNLIQHFDQNFQRKLYESYPINFQNKIVNPVDIFTSQSAFISSMDDENLAKILTHNLTIGGEIKRADFLEDFYVERIYEEEGSSNNKQTTQNIIKNIQSSEVRRPIFIHNIAGMGKSTEITKLGLLIKENFRNFWVLKVELGTESFLRAFNSWNKENLIELFQSLIVGSFEKEIFKELYESGKVAILLDGFDEIPQAGYETVLDDLFKIILRKENLKNIFIFTSRISLTESFKKQETKDDFTAKVFTYNLTPFDDKQKINFIYKWIEKGLKKEEFDENIKQELPEFCKNLISKWSEVVIDDEDFLGVPLQMKMLAEIFTFKVNEEYQLTKNLPKVPEKFEITEFFKSFMDTKLLILFQEKKEIAQELFMKIVSSGLKVKKILINFACDTLSGGKYFIGHPRCREQCEIFKISKELHQIMISIGLISHFVEDEVRFIHKTYPEFLVAEKFINMIFSDKTDENFLNEITHKNHKVLDVVLQQTYTNRMAAKFVDEFLKLKGIPSASGIKIILKFQRNFPSALTDPFKLSLKDGLGNFALLLMECLSELGSLKFYYEVHKTIAMTLSDFNSDKEINKEKVLNNFSKILPKVFEVYERKHEEEVFSNVNLDLEGHDLLTLIAKRFRTKELSILQKSNKDAFDVISMMMAGIFNFSSPEQCLKEQKTLELIRNWKVLEDFQMKQILITKRLNDSHVAPKATGEENFLSFWREFDDNIIHTLLQCRHKFPYIVLLEYLKFDGAMNILKEWATTKGIKLDKITKKEIIKNKSKVLSFFSVNFIAIKVESIIDSKFLNPKILTNLAKKDVDEFTDIDFPFVTIKDIEYTCVTNKLNRVEEIFANNSQDEYQELFDLWFEKVFELCKQWNICHLSQIDVRSLEAEFYGKPDPPFIISIIPIIDFTAACLIGYLDIEKISFDSLNLDVCKFIKSFIWKLLRKGGGFFNSGDGKVEKYNKDCKQKIEALSNADYEVSVNHDCKNKKLLLLYKIRISIL